MVLRLAASLAGSDLGASVPNPDLSCSTRYSSTFLRVLPKEDGTILYGLTCSYNQESVRIALL